MNIPIMTTPVLADFTPDEFLVWLVSDGYPTVRYPQPPRSSADMARWAMAAALLSPGYHIRLRCIRTGSLYIVRRKRAART